MSLFLSVIDQFHVVEHGHHNAHTEEPTKEDYKHYVHGKDIVTLSDEDLILDISKEENYIKTLENINIPNSQSFIGSMGILNCWSD